MDKKILIFCLTVLTACGLLIHGVKTKPVATPMSTPVSTTFIGLPAITAVPTNRSLPVSADVPVAVAPANYDAAASALQRRLAARRDAMNRWREWATRDLQGALTAVAALPAGPERDEAVEAICFAQIQINPALAMEMAQTLQQPDNTVQDLLQQWAASDAAAAFVWASQQPAGLQHDKLIDRVAYMLSQTEPAQAASLVMEQMPPGPAQDEAAMTVLHQWGEKNLAAAAAWAQTLPAGPLQARATQELENLAEYQRQLATQ